MRTVIMIATIVALLLGGSFTSYRFIHNTTEMIIDQIDTVEESISNQNWDLAKSELSNVQQSWDKSNFWWSILIVHQEIDSIYLSIKRLEKFIETENLSLSIAEVSTLKLQIESIYNTEKISVRNIL